MKVTRAPCLKKHLVVNNNTVVGVVVNRSQKKAKMPATKAQKMRRIAGMRKLIPPLTAGAMVGTDVEAALLVLAAVVLFRVVVALVLAFFEVVLWARRVVFP